MKKTSDDSFSSLADEKQKWQKIVQRQSKQALRRLTICREQLQDCLKWEKTYQIALLLQANLYRVTAETTCLECEDWFTDGLVRKIDLDPRSSPSEQIKHLFRLSKKQQIAIPHLEKQVALREKKCEHLQESYDALNSLQTTSAMEQWISFYQAAPKKKKTAAVSLPYREFYSSSGLLIRVGKGAKSNDDLTFRLSKGSDWWFHIRDYPGAHVVLEVHKGRKPDESAIKDALQLAAIYSKGCHEKSVEIVVTECKYLRRLGKHALGKVQVSQHRVMNIHPNVEAFKKIKTQRVI